MDAASQLRQAHRTAALITGGLIPGLVMYAAIAGVLRTSHAPFESAPSLPAYLLGPLSLALRLVNAPRYETWEAWLATPAPRP